MPHFVRKAVIGAATALVTVGSVTPAHADPGFAPASGDIVGVGSDTTQDVMNALVKSYNATTPSHRLASWDATPAGSTITPKAGCAAIARPDGSGSGIKALVGDATGNCLDFARSSRAKKTDGTENALAFFSFGRDAVAWAAQSKTNAPATLSKVQLSRIYRCSPLARKWNQVKGHGTATIRPYLPQTGSGTRAFFLNAIGLTDAQVGSCVNQSIQENEGKSLPKNPNEIEPYSIAKFIAQRYKHHNNNSGTVLLHKIAGVSPLTGTGATIRINSKFPTDFMRLVYNVVKKKADGTVDPGYVTVFGKGGVICSRSAIISDYGFLPLGNGCGAQF